MLYELLTNALDASKDTTTVEVDEGAIVIVDQRAGLEEENLTTLLYNTAYFFRWMVKTTFWSE